MSSAPYGSLETRRRILQATWQLIEERGSAMSLGDVAERAEVSRQAIYLHFKDRAGLLIALVRYMDEVLAVEELAAPVFEAPTAEEALRRLMHLHSVLMPKIDSVARVLEAAQDQGEALAAAWRDRMANRKQAHLAIVRRNAEEGRLSEGWTVEAAADLLDTLTKPGPWRELIQESGWTADQYEDRITQLLGASLLRQ
ncbi:MAG: TetR/AcrR family transcriptional regulator [bacterium]